MGFCFRSLGLRLSPHHTFDVKFGFALPFFVKFGLRLAAHHSQGSFRVCHFPHAPQFKGLGFAAHFLLDSGVDFCGVIRFAVWVCGLPLITRFKGLRFLTSDLCWFRNRFLQGLSRLTAWVYGLPLTTLLGSRVCYFLLLLGVSVKYFCVSSVDRFGCAACHSPRFSGLGFATSTIVRFDLLMRVSSALEFGFMRLATRRSF